MFGLAREAARLWLSQLRAVQQTGTPADPQWLLGDATLEGSQCRSTGLIVGSPGCMHG